MTNERTRRGGAAAAAALAGPIASALDHHMFLFGLLASPAAARLGAERIVFAGAAMSSVIVGAVPVEQTGVTTSIVTSHVQADGVPRESGYTAGFALLLVVGLVAAGAALLIPSAEVGALVPEPVPAAD